MSLAEGGCGLQKLSLVDYPGELACVLFSPGCNLRCPFCHNPELVTGSPEPSLFPLDEIKRYLLKRKHLLGAVVFSGGEPLLQDDLGDMIAFARSLGYKVKVDTNGTLPDRLEELRVDYVAMDLKTDLARYDRLIPQGNDGRGGELRERLIRSIGLLLSGTICPDFEFRTTLVPGIAEEEDIRSYLPLIRGCRNIVLAQFRPGRTLDPSYAAMEPFSSEKALALRDLCRAEGFTCRLRGLAARED